MKSNTKIMVLAAMFLAIGVFLPSLVMRIPGIGRMLLPMHIPVLLSGFMCGPIYGGIVGFILPLLNSLLFGAPPMVPVAIPMAVELLCYGLLTGILYSMFQKKRFGIYLSLIPSMLIGRVVWGIVSYMLIGVFGNSFNLSIFFTQAVLNGIPGIIAQIILIPILVIGIKKAIKE